MTANRDAMSTALVAVYGPDNNLADWEAQHWVAEGFEPCGPGDKAAWYAAEGASGTSYGDLECDYWSNVYAGGGGGGVAPSNTVAPALDVSTLTAGGTVTVSDGTWTGDATITYTYQWQSSPTGLGSWTDISGATSDSLVSTETQVDTWVRCVVTGTNGVGNSSANSGTCAIQHVFTTLGGTWWVDAAREVASGASSTSQWALNRGSTSVPHARLGSSGRAELRGSYGLVLPGVTSNMAYVPAVALTNATVAIQFKQPLSTMLTGLGANTVAGRGTISGGAFSDWGVTLGGSALGGNSWMMSGLGASGWSGSAIPLAIRDAADVWYRWSRDDATGNVTCHYSTDGTSWTAVGSLTSAAGALTSANGYFLVGGSVYNSMTTAMTVRRMVISSSGTTVFDADFTTASAFATSFTESSSNAATVTINATSGADTNDPLLLPHTGTNYLYIPDTGNADYASIPAAASGPLDITGDIDLIAKVALDDWTPTNQKAIITRGTAGSTAAWRLYVNNTGYLQISWVDSGAAAQSLISDAAPSVANGAVKWIRGTLDLDNGAGDCVARFYTSDDGSSWTQLGTDRTLGATSTMRTGTAGQVRLGSYWSGTNPCIGGKLYRAIIKSGIDGTIALDADFTANTNQSSFTESSSNAATVTINRATSGRKSVMVTRPVWLFGTDDYMEVADNEAFTATTSDSFTALVVLREHATPGSYSALASQRVNGGVGDGWIMQHNGTAFQMYAQIQDGAANKAYSGGGTWSAGVLSLVGMIRRVSDGILTTFVGPTIAAGTGDTTTDTINSTTALQIGKDTASTSYLNGEVLAVAYFRSALTTDDLAAIASYFGV